MGDASYLSHMINERFPQLASYFALVIGLIAAVVLGRYAGQGDTKQIFLIFAAGVGVAVILMLGKYYWMLLPFAFLSGLPAIPIGGKTLELGELAAAGCTLVFIMHLAFKRAEFKLGNLATLAVLASFAWVAVIYMLNPVGFAIFGSEAVGFRDYQRIILGVCAFVVLANQRIGEKEAKILIFITIVSSLLGLAWGFFDGVILGRAEGIDDEGNEYTWHQSLSGPAFTLILWMFSKYKSSQIFSISYPVRTPFLMVCFYVAMQSGKRAVLGTMFLVPLVASMLRREWKYFLIYGFSAFLIVTFLVAGHGNFFELPYRMQRSLGNLPGNWDPNIKRMTADGGDSFRSIMRELAWEKIKASPVVGSGLGFNWSETAGINVSNYAQNIHIALSLGNSWHNTWLGLWADFGLPAVIIHAIILILYFKIAFSNFRRSDRSSQLGVYCMMVLIGLIFTILRSYTSGSSNIAFYFYWQFGIAVAIWSTLNQSRSDAQKHDKFKKVQGLHQILP